MLSVASCFAYVGGQEPARFDFVECTNSKETTMVAGQRFTVTAVDGHMLKLVGASGYDYHEHQADRFKLIARKPVKEKEKVHEARKDISGVEPMCGSVRSNVGGAVA